MSNLAAEIETKIKCVFPYLKYTTEKHVRYRGQKLFFDFTIPDLNVYIEVQGEQHYKFVPFFHKFASNFRQQKFRDQVKQEWCAENDIILVTISYKEVGNLTNDLFRNKILSAVKEYNSGY